MDETEGFIVIRPWMVELGLSGNELIVFALINGFSMDGKSTFNGGLEYLCNQTGIARRTVINCLKRLTEAGLIKKTSVTKNGVDYSAYSVSKEGCKNCTSEKIALVQKVHSGSEKIALVGSEKIAPKKKDIKEKESKYISPPIVPPRGESARASRLPADWMPSEEDIKYCQLKRPDLDVPDTVEAFRDYWHAKAGRDACKLDWHATWRSWVRNERARPKRKKSLEEVIAERVAAREMGVIDAQVREVGYAQITC